MATRAKIEANRRYNNARMDNISIRVDKSERWPDLIGAAAAACGLSRRAWMMRTIRAGFVMAGVSLDSLPPMSAAGPVEAAADDDGG